MSNDISAPTIDDCLSDPDRVLDKIKAAKAGRSYAGALRVMFNVFQPAGGSALQATLVQAEQNLQRSQPKSAPTGPHI